MTDDRDVKSARCPGMSTADILANDRRPPPESFKEGNVDFLENGDFDTDAYTSLAFHRREVETVWGHCWQVACREDEVGRPGDYLVYDLAENSALIVRDRNGELRGFVNSCPHRGTRLCDDHGNAPRIRCPFHAFTWNLEGKLRELPCSWDFTPADTQEFSLQPVLIDTWGGFVFVNFDDNAEPLKNYLQELPRHFERWPLDRRFTAAHVAKRFECNWKISIEAFIETFHVIGLHPQSLPFFGDVNSQYDIWQGQRHYSRMINPSGVASPHLGNKGTPQRVVEAAARFGLCEGGSLAKGETPRQRISMNLRRFYRETLGVDSSELSDSEVIDVIEYNLFPNLIMFGGYGSPLAYRSRPDGDNPNRSIFEVWLLLPYPEAAPRPASAPMRMLEDSEHFGDVKELSYFGPILDQDAEMMPRVQAGLRSSRKRHVTLSRYQESRIRQMRQTLAEYMA